MQNFSERLIARKERLGWSLEKLSEESGVSPRSISSYIAQATGPNLENIVHLSVALGVSPIWLLGGDHATEVERSTSAYVMNDAPILSNPPWRKLSDITLRAALTDLSKNDDDSTLAELEGVVAELRRRKTPPPLKPPKETLGGVTAEIADKARGGAPDALHKALNEDRARLRKHKAAAPTDSKPAPKSGAGGR